MVIVSNKNRTAYTPPKQIYDFELNSFVPHKGSKDFAAVIHFHIPSFSL